MKETEIIFTKSELIILGYLLDHHIGSGDYFRNREQHYKMCKELLKKIDLATAFFEAQ